MIHFDCHAHVYENITTVPGARYTPAATAPLKTWCNHLQTYGLTGGVIVQVSFLGTDNTQLCAALAQLDRKRFAGVAVVSPSATDEEIDHLYTAGVRGFRWNLVRGESLPDLHDPQVRLFLDNLRQRNMHIEVQLEGARLAKFINPLLDTGCTVVVDHLGLPSEPEPGRDPWIRAVQQRAELSMLYVKFSAPYRTAFDTRQHALELQSCLSPEHIVWGSDWPHTQHEKSVDFHHMVDWRARYPFASDSVAVKNLYGLGH